MLHLGGSAVAKFWRRTRHKLIYGATLAVGGILRCFSMVAPCVLSRVPELALVSFVAMIGPSLFDQAGQINTRSPPE
jgi:hypothetical protein